MKSPFSVKYTLILGAIAALTLSFVFIKASAQNQSSNQSLVVSPAAQEIQADPGNVTKIKATIKNQSNASLSMKVRVEDFTASGDEGQIALTNQSVYSVSKWTTLSPETFKLGAGESREITATVRIPSSAAGGRYGSFVFSALGSPEQNQSSAAVNQEIASIFLVRISGPVNEQLALNEFHAPSFSEEGHIPFSMKFRNGGNVHVKTGGLINVTGMFGHKVTDLAVKPTNVFPGADRLVVANLDNPFLVGPYTATAVMYYGSKNEVLNATTSFFVFPARIVAIVLLILVLLYFMRERLRKAFKALFS